jgi:hypothetical protein
MVARAIGDTLMAPVMATLFSIIHALCHVLASPTPRA